MATNEDELSPPAGFDDGSNTLNRLTKKVDAMLEGVKRLPNTARTLISGLPPHPTPAPSSLREGSPPTSPTHTDTGSDRGDNKRMDTQQLRPSKKNSGGFDNIPLAAKVTGTAIAAAGLPALKASADIDRYTLALERLAASQEKAKEKLAYLDRFALETPRKLKGATEAFLTLADSGIDPTGQLMNNLGDASSALDIDMAKGADAIAAALGGDNKSLTKLFNIEAETLGKGERQVVNYRYTGKQGETRSLLVKKGDKAATAGAINQMLKDRYGGAMVRIHNGWGGILNNIFDLWKRFQRAVLESPAFIKLRERLRGFLDTLNEMAHDGRLRDWANDVGASVVKLIDLLIGAGEALSKIAKAVGGWENLATIIAGLIALRFALFATSAGTAMIGAAGGAGVLSGALTALGAAILANPVVAGIAAIVAAVAIGGYLIYKNWDWVSAKLGDGFEYVGGVIDDASMWIGDSLDLLRDKFSAGQAASSTWIGDSIDSVRRTLSSWRDEESIKIGDALDLLRDKFSAGQTASSTWIGDSIDSVHHSVSSWREEGATKIGDSLDWLRGKLSTGRQSGGLWIGDSIDALGLSLASWREGASTKIGDSLDWLRGKLSTGRQSTGSWIGDSIDALRHTLASWQEGAATGIGETIDSLRAKLAAGRESGGGWIGDTLDALQRKLGSGGTLFSEITGGLTGLPERFLTAGREMIGNLINGLTGGVGEKVGEVKKAVTDLLPEWIRTRIGVDADSSDAPSPLVAARHGAAPVALAAGLSAGFVMAEPPVTPAVPALNPTRVLPPHQAASVTPVSQTAQRMAGHPTVEASRRAAAVRGSPSPNLATHLQRPAPRVVPPLAGREVAAAGTAPPATPPRAVNLTLEAPIHVHAAPGMDAQAVALLVRAELERAQEQLTARTHSALIDEA